MKTRIYLEHPQLIMQRITLEPPFQPDQSWRKPFSPQLLIEAQNLALQELPLSDRLDFSQEDIFAIDDPDTSEVDDAFHLVKHQPWGWRVAIHIADPGAFVTPGSPLDLEANARGTTLYLPEQKVLLFPSVLAESAMSLLPGVLRPALSFLFDVMRDGELQNPAIQLSRIRVKNRLSYEEANALMSQASAEAKLLCALRGAADALHQKRVDNGSASFIASEYLPEVVGEQVTLKRFEASPSRDLVSELMIATNAIAAQHLLKAKAPAIYRSQLRFPSPPGTVRLSKTELSIKPKPHAGLGLPVYVQATSPIRRYNDLLLQRQLTSTLRKAPPTYDSNTLWAIASASEQRNLQAKKLEASSRAHWMLYYFSTHIGQELHVIVLSFETTDTYQVDVVGYGLRATLHSSQHLLPGDKLSAIVKAASPKRKLLELSTR
jgi:exoribonuclease II